MLSLMRKFRVRIKNGYRITKVGNIANGMETMIVLLIGKTQDLK